METRKRIIRMGSLCMLAVVLCLVAGITACGNTASKAKESVFEKDVAEWNQTNATKEAEESKSADATSDSSEEIVPTKTEAVKMPTGIATDFSKENLQIVSFNEFQMSIPSTWIEEESKSDLTKIYYPDRNKDSIFEVGMLPKKNYVSDMREELYRDLVVTLNQSQEGFLLVGGSDSVINGIPILKIVSREKYNGKDAVAIRTYTLYTKEDTRAKMLYTTYIQPVTAAQEHFLDYFMVLESIRTKANKFDDALDIAASEELKKQEAAIPQEDKDAVVATANSLLNSNYYTRKELINEMIDMGYEKNTAIYGADHCSIEWTEDQKANF